MSQFLTGSFFLLGIHGLDGSMALYNVEARMFTAVCESLIAVPVGFARYIGSTTAMEWPYQRSRQPHRGGQGGVRGKVKVGLAKKAVRQKHQRQKKSEKRLNLPPRGLCSLSAAYAVRPLAFIIRRLRSHTKTNAAARWCTQRRCAGGTCLFRFVVLVYLSMANV